MNHNHNYQIALNRITECKKNKTTFLYLSNLKLTTLPSEIGNCTNLERIFLDKNKINLLPEKLHNLVIS